MPDSNTNSWSRKGESIPAPSFTEEKIILPNEDVFDLNDFIENIDDQTSDKVQDSPKPESNKTVNPEHLRYSNEEKYFYQTKKTKTKDGANWFILTFLMTIVILGSIYFYFLIEEKNNQISGLERQISNKADTRVKGVRESLNEGNATTVTTETINTPTFSILQSNQNPEFKISNINVSIPYFNNQIGNKTILSKESQIDNRKFNDRIEVYSAEKQDLIDKNVIIKKIIDTDNNIENTNNSINSTNNVNFTELKNKADSKNKIYVGTTSKYMYVIVVNNETLGIDSQVKTANFLKNIITNTSFN